MVAPPGWWPDPRRRHEWRFWDGARWTPRVADHGEVSFDAVAGPSRQLRDRRWAYAFAAVGAVIVLVLLALFVDRTLLTHDLVDAHFENGAAPFDTAQRDGFFADVPDGTYRIRTTAADTGVIDSYAAFSRTASSVDLSADVVAFTAPDGAYPWTAIGVANEAGDEMYLLGITAEGDVTIARVDADNTVHDLVSGVDDAVAAGPPVELKLSLVTRGPMSSGARATAYVDGRQVLTVDDPQGFDTFAHAVLNLTTDASGVEVRFDDVVATVPGE